MQATSLGLSYIEIVLRIVLSLVIGGVIGLERGSKSQPAGIRTHSIVCLAACLIMSMYLINLVQEILHA